MLLNVLVSGGYDVSCEYKAYLGRKTVSMPCCMLLIVGCTLARQTFVICWCGLWRLLLTQFVRLPSKKDYIRRDSICSFAFAAN